MKLSQIPSFNGNKKKQKDFIERQRKLRKEQRIKENKEERKRFIEEEKQKRLRNKKTIKKQISNISNISAKEISQNISKYNSRQLTRLFNIKLKQFQSKYLYRVSAETRNHLIKEYKIELLKNIYKFNKKRLKTNKFTKKQKEAFYNKISKLNEILTEKKLLYRSLSPENIKKTVYIKPMDLNSAANLEISNYLIKKNNKHLNSFFNILKNQTNLEILETRALGTHENNKNKSIINLLDNLKYKDHVLIHEANHHFFRHTKIYENEYAIELLTGLISLSKKFKFPKKPEITKYSSEYEKARHDAYNYYKTYGEKSFDYFKKEFL